MPDQTGAEVADIGLDFPYIIAEGIQFGDHDLIPVNLSVPMPARYQSPRHDDDQDSYGSDYLGQASEVLHLRIPSLMPRPMPIPPSDKYRSPQDITSFKL